MDLLRLGDEKITRNISRRDIGAVSLTDGKSRKVALEAQEKQLRIACEVESARGIEGGQNIFVCYPHGRRNRWIGLLDSGEGKLRHHSDIGHASTDATPEREKNRNRPQLYPIAHSLPWISRLRYRY